MDGTFRHLFVMTHDDLRDEGCFDDPPDLPVLPMGKHVDGTEPSEAALAKADAARQAATSAIAAGDVESALERLTEALIDAPSALLFSLRGDLLLKLRRPIAALHDAEAALAFNVNSVRALKVRQMPEEQTLRKG
jgi:suppressor of tumorigenicity protein 13